MNGENMAKAVQGMTQDEKLVFIISEVGNLKTTLLAHVSVVAEAVREIGEMKLSLVKLPTHCAHESDFIKMCNIRSKLDERLGVLEKESTGRKAVFKIWFGAGGLGIVGMFLLILKFIFEVI